MGSPAGIIRELVRDLNISPINSSYRPPMPSPAVLHPNLDWSLQDLKEELDTLQRSLTKSPVLPNDLSPFKQEKGSYSFSWKELSVTADFGRSGRPFRISAFDSDSDSEEESLEFQKKLEQKETCVESKDSEGRSIPGSTHAIVNIKEPWLLPKTEISEGLMFELERGRLQRVQEEIRQRRFVLEAAVEEENVRSAAILNQVEKEEESKREVARRIDKQYQRSIAEVRDIHLSAIQREHEQRSQVEERKLRREADAKKREALAREERERQEKAKAEAEAKRIEDAKIAVEAERKKHAEDMALQKAEAEKLAKEAKERAVEKSKSSGPKAKVSESGANVENLRRMKLNALLEMSQPLQMDPSLKKSLKDHERSLTKLLQQVSATQEQVRIKSINLINELLSSPYQAFSLTTFVSKLMSQCEIQVSKLPSFAFALAQVVVNISSRIPDVMEIVFAKLNQVCIYTVPKYYTFTKSQFDNDRDYYKLLGYLESEGGIESTDDYVSRMSAYVTLYAAIIQAEIDGTSRCLKEGWIWCARLLNALPADRLTASALEAFLKVAGFKLYMVYQKAFLKLLNVIVVDFIGSLKQQKDPDSRAVLSRLETYIGTRQFMKEPDGRSMPKSDLSSALKC